MSFFRHWLRFLAAIFRTSPWSASLTLGVTLLTGLQPAGEFWALQGLVNSALSGLGSPSPLGPGPLRPIHWVLLLSGIVLAGDLLRRLQPYLMERLRQNGELALEGRLLTRAAATPLAELEGPVFFDLFTRARDGLRRETLNLIGAALSLVRSISALLSILTVLASAHWATTAVVLAGVIPYWLAERAVSRRITFIWREQTEERRRAQYLSDLLTQRSSAQEIRQFGLAGELLRRWRENALGPMRKRLAIVAAAGRSQQLSGMVGALSYGGAVVILALTAAAGRISIGGFAAAVKVAQDFQVSLHELVWTSGRLYRSGAFTIDFWQFLDSAPAAPVPAPATPHLPPVSAPVPAPATPHLPPVSASETAPAPAAAPAVDPAVARASEIVCESVCFSYPGIRQGTLTDISFRVAPGELIALVGENGAGKTTLVKLLMGLYKPDSGTICVDGVNPASDAGAAVRTRIAPVFQDFVRYAVKAGENIGLGDVEAIDCRSRIEAAAAGSGADAVIAVLPHGYETVLGKEWEGGQELSGGQWQKLAIGRGYMRQASLLVLDEPTAALDPLAELEVFRRFRELVRGRTGLLISHRLGAARLADRILVLKEGRLIESGSHEELMALDGEYAALFRAQAAWYA